LTAKITIEDRDLGMKQIIAELTTLAKKKILVGIQERSKTQVTYKAGRKGEANVDIGEYATENEFGTSKIPQRSFIRSSFDENLSLIEGFIEKKYTEIINGSLTTEHALGQIGRNLEKMVKAKIRQIQLPPNAKRTIELKGSSKPLIDFGNMINAVRFIVKTRKN